MQLTKTHRRLLWKRLAWLSVAGVCMLWATMSQTLYAQDPTPGGAIIPDKPSLPPTPVPLLEAKLEIERYYTIPEQVRAQETFELHLEIKNIGTMPATGFFVRNIECSNNNTFSSEDQCNKPIPTVAGGQTVEITLHLRYTGLATNPSDKPPNKPGIVIFKYAITNDLSDKELGKSQRELGIYVLPARPIEDATSTLVRPFSQPNLVVNRTWIAKARSTVGELLTEVPLVINVTPVATGAGGPEFELVVELQNQGHVEATNIFINFCEVAGKFNPIGSTCQKHVPVNLAPGGHAVASQTLAYKGTATPVARGEEAKLTITYEFRYAEQWVQKTITQTVYLYPQAYPAVTPIPAYAPTTPHLEVNTPILNIRQGPNTNYPVVAQAQKGQQFTITGKEKAANNEWWQINFNGMPAWVHAYYVIAWGTENIAVITNIPAMPLRQPPPPPAPTPTPNPSPVGLHEIQATTIPAVFPPGTQDDALLVQIESPNDQAHLVKINQSGEGSEHAPNASAGVNQLPLVVIDRYQTVPARPLVDQPFQLELILHNIGETPARRLMLGWSSPLIVPLGTGTIHWLDDLPPGANAKVTGQFVFAGQMLDALIQLPVQVRYTDADGRVVEYTEQVALLLATPTSAVASPGKPSEPEDPLWLRILLGLAGLGAESR